MVKRFQICYNNRVLQKLNNAQYQPERGSRKGFLFHIDNVRQMYYNILKVRGPISQRGPPLYLKKQ